MTRIFAGIGSRSTPISICGLMTDIGSALAAQGWTLRSGHAPGADQAFEAGAKAEAEVFLPWPSFESDVPVLAKRVIKIPTVAAEVVACEFHPAWYRLSRGARLLQARNTHQVLGLELDQPARLVVCWTTNGSLDGKDPDTGGTGQALRIATAHEVPVYNLKRDDHRELFEAVAQGSSIDGVLGIAANA